MGAFSSTDSRPQELAEFRKLPITGTIEEFDIPQSIPNRRPTNRKYIVLFIVCILFLLPFLIYGFLFSDLRILLGRYDNCGNFCGYNNSKVDNVPCSGEQYENKPYLQFESFDRNRRFSSLHRTCVAQCDSSEYIISNHFCFPKSSSNGAKNSEVVNANDSVGLTLKSLEENWWRIVLGVLIAIVLGIGALGLYRFAVACIVWSTLIGTITVCALVCVIFVYFGIDIGRNPAKYTDNRYRSEKDLESLKYGAFLFGGIFGIIALIFLILMLCLRKRIGLIIQLMKEATKGIFATPTILVVPVVTSIIIKVLLISVVVGCLVLSTGSSLVKHGNNYIYERRPIFTFIIAFNAIMVLWMIQFVTGCQYMVIAGTISSWFFNKKHQISSRLWKSVYITFKFHLGTIAVGSLIITLVQLLRAIIRSLTRGKIAKAIIDCCLAGLEEFLKYLTKNAYIMTAMHGQSFYRSGKRAAKLLMSNFIDVVALNSVGDFVIGVSAFLVVIIATAINYVMFSGVDVYMAVAPMFLLFILTCFVVGCVFELFTTTIDTIFLCFCEDCNINDGMARPYCMSTGMMQFMNDSKAIMGEKKK